MFLAESIAAHERKERITAERDVAALQRNMAAMQAAVQRQALADKHARIAQEESAALERHEGKLGKNGLVQHLRRAIGNAV